MIARRGVGYRYKLHSFTKAILHSYCRAQVQQPLGVGCSESTALLERARNFNHGGTTAYMIGAIQQPIASFVVASTYGFRFEHCLMTFSTSS